MSIAALSPVAPEPLSPMITSVTPTLDPDTPTPSATVSTVPLSLDQEHQSQDGASSPGPGPSRGSLTGGGPHLGRDPSQRSKKPPPLHTGADWKVVLHLPEIETWLRSTSDRVTQLTHSVGQDSDNRHVDVHLVQLKDICEDISDHVEQIHALLETEFSLKLLSYSVNIIVDIRTVQLLWHQLRVSVLVLKERLLQGLQDSNGNYTRQTDILQAFSQDQHQTRLDALTEVDDCGQLTIRCSQDYFSLDCGITAFELSDYSPSDEPEAQETEQDSEEPPQELDQTQGPEGEGPCLSNHELHNSLPELATPADSTNHNHSPSILPSIPSHSESAKRPLQGVSHSTEVSPTQPSLPKRAALFSDGGTRVEDRRGGLRKVSPLSGLQFQAELSRSTPSLMDPPDRSKFWLELDSVYPENVSQSYESLQVMNGRNLQRNNVSSRQGGRSQGSVQRLLTDPRSPSGVRSPTTAPPPLQAPVSQNEISKQMERTQKETHAHSEGDSDSSLPSPMREQFLSSDLEASGEESDPRPRPGKTAVWIVKRQGQKGAQVSSKASPDREHWYGSEEFLALPAQLRKTEMLAMKLESLAQSIPLRPSGCDSTQDALQDVDDWDLTELNPDWDVGESADNMSSIGESGDDMPSLLPPLLPYRRNLVSRFSSTSSSDIAPSLDESIESGPLSDLQSEEDEGRRSADRRLQLITPPVDMRGGASLVHQLLEDIQNQDNDPAIWKKIECFVQQLDGFISWLQEALDSTENWTQPRQDLDSLRVYLDTHLSFKLNVDSHSALKESVMEEGRALLTVITSHQSGLKDILHMVSSQWDQLQRQIRRQHGWMLRTLRCIQARLLYTSQSHEHFAASGDLSANRQAPCSSDGLKAELIPSQCEAQRAALAEQMAIKLRSLHYPSSASRRHYSQLARNNSLQDFETEYQELWDWLMDMDAMVTDSHQLMMSEEQRHHLFKSSHAELMMMESRKTSLLGRAESLKRSGTELPENFHRRVHNLTHTWRQLEKILSEHSGPSSSSQQNQSANMNSLLVGGRGVAAVENPRSALSPLTNSLLEQLEARIKELKAWLRDTELLIFNSCLGRDKDASEQLQSFKSLCSEVRARRRGVSSVLKLCQKLLQQSQSGPMAEVGPEAEQHREALQLLSINLERRWEAIVMQALQWQNRLKRELGEQQVPGSFLEPGLVDLHQMSPVPAGPVAPPPDDSWEWDETDMTITELEPQQVPQPDLMHNLSSEPNLPSDSILSNGNQSDGIQTGVPANQSPEIMSNMRERSSSEIQPSVISQTLPPNNNNVYQVYSLHSVELYRQPQFPLSSSLLHKSKLGKCKQHLLLKSLSKDSSFSSIESLPDLLGGLMSNSRGGDRIVGYQDVESERESGRGSGQSASSRRSESESGIVSDTGEMETMANSEIQEEEQGDEEEEEEEKKQRKDETVDGSHLTRHKNTRYNQRTKREESMKEKGWREDIRGGNREEEKRRRHRRGGAEAVEILINCRGILTPADSDSDFEVGGLGVGSSKPLMSCTDITGFKVDQINGLETPPALSRQASSPVLSQGSSLESLLALGVELFPCKDQLHRSASLESCLAPCRSAEETGGSLASLRELDLGQSREVDRGEPGKEKNTESVQGEPSSGELSRRTLDLLKRLENIQSPLEAKLTRSVSDMTLRSSSPQRSKLPASPSLGGHHAPLSGVSGSLRKGPPSLINESSATASLTELSSTEDSSLGSEDFAMLRNQRHVFLDPTMAANANSSSHKKRCHGHTRGGQGMDEADAASLSLVVNVSCTSACTDEDEDDSDLLSSSTLTLTEEELGVRDGEDGEEERLSGASSGNDDDEDDDEEEMEGSYVLGLEYMKRELQSWIRSPRASSCSSSKTEAGLRDELQCGTNLSSTFTSSCQNKEQHSFQNRSKLIETNTNSGNNKTKREKKEQEEEEENRRNATRSFISQFVDDVENGNVDQSCLKGKDEDDELLREESSVFTKKGESLRETYVFPKTGETVQDVSDLIVKTESNSTKQLSPSPSCELLPLLSKRASSLVGQLRGELPCHSSSVPSPPSLSPVEDCRSHDALHSSRPATGGRKSITSQEKFKFSSFVTEQTRREVRDKASSLPPRKRHNSHSSCCNHLPSPSNLRPCSVDEGKKENVHDFVMEIIDMTSLALKSKKNQPEEPNQTDSSGSRPDQGPASLTQIKDKVLEHSHQPLHLRKGDFYAYLSLSSHDSDCGEVSQCSEEKSSTPAPYSIPTYVTPTQGLHSPSPELFTSTRQQMSNSAPSSRRSSPGPDSKNSFCTLDLKSVNGEESTSPSLSLPPSPDIRDEETLFAACTEEVYLGPPLCYSMVLNKKPRRFLLKETLEFLPSLGSGYKQKDSLAYSPCSEPNDSLQEEPGFTPGDSLSCLTPSEELVLDQEQDHLYFQGSSPTEGTQRSFSPLPEPCYSSFSTSLPSNSVSASLQGPGSKPKADNPSSPPPVSSGAEEENRGEDPYLLCDVAGGEVAAAASVSAPQEESSRNEGPPYLNPRARVAPIDSSAAECLADTKALESNMGAVMTKISVCSSATNPSKEAATTATRINPKINCSAMREADREEGERRGEVDTRWVKQEEKGRRGRSGSQQEAKTAAEKQVSSQSGVSHSNRTAQGRSQTSARLPTSRTRTVSRLPVLGVGTSRIQL